MASNNQAIAPVAETAIAKRELIDRTADRVQGLIEAGRLHLPLNYSWENAVMGWWLTLQETVDRNDKPVLEVCSKESIANATLSMVVQGLNPDKQQCYAIAYGTTLVCQRSYFGDQALVRRIFGTETTVRAAIVFDGDEVEVAVEDGLPVVRDHKRKEMFPKVVIASITGAYAVVTFPEESGRRSEYEIMSMDQIKKSWAKSKTYGKQGAPHESQPDEFAKRTVIRRLCKRLINDSDDSYLKTFVEEQDELVAELAVDLDVDENANMELVDPETLTDEKRAELQEKLAAARSRTTVTYDADEPAEGDDGQNTEGGADTTGDEPAADDSRSDSGAPESTEGDAANSEPEASPSSPSARFIDFIDAKELDATAARKKLAELVSVDDARKLTNEHYQIVLDDPDSFLALMGVVASETLPLGDG